MRSIAWHRAPALILVLLLGAMSTGMPSHHHDVGEAGPIIVDAGHHGHGVLLVDTSERIVTQAVFAALPSPSLDGVPGWAVRTLSDGPRTTSEPPEAQPPPSARPRAPPVHG